jgi:hypothetical protein
VQRAGGGAEMAARCEVVVERWQAIVGCVREASYHMIILRKRTVRASRLAPCTQKPGSAMPSAQLTASNLTKFLLS